MVKKSSLQMVMAKCEIDLAQALESEAPHEGYGISV